MVPTLEEWVDTTCPELAKDFATHVEFLTRLTEQERATLVRVLLMSTRARLEDRISG